MNDFQPSQNTELPPFKGFKEHTLTVFFKDRLAHLQLLLPNGVHVDGLVLARSEVAASSAHSFKMQALAAAEQRRAQEESADAFEDAVSARSSSKANSGSASSQNAARGSLKKSGKLDVSIERECLQDKYHTDKADRAAHSRNYAEVYAWDEPLKLISNADVKSPDRDWRERDKALYESLYKMGSFRRLGGVQNELEDMGTDLKILREQQPHFSEVVDLILGRVRLAQAKGTPLRLPPILLAGPPGVGKTHFTLELARVMDRPVHRHSMDMSHTGASLMGSARNWSNTHVGSVFEMVCLGDRADPLILIDELDKARRTERDDPTAPLHSLLEPLTATKVKDISADIEFDSSHVFWVATANDLGRIPDPIKSRFRLFNIQVPSAEQAIALAQAVGMSMHQRMNIDHNDQENSKGGAPAPLFEAPPLRLFNLLAHLTPREQIQSLEHAYAAALANGRRRIERQDLPIGVLMDDDDNGGDGDGDDDLAKSGQHPH